MAAVLVGNDPASEAYVGSKVRSCHEIGFESTLIRHDATVTETVLLQTIADLNQNPDIDGFIVQLPLPRHINEERVMLAIDYRKDVDGFHPVNFGRMAQGMPAYLPATPFGIVQMLERYGIATSGKHCVVVGRSNIVGTPISILLSRKGRDCTVTLTHSRTADLKAVQTYRATGLRWSQYPELAKKLGVTWKADTWRKKTEEHRDDLPLSEIEISEATVLIDVSKLSERNCKRTEAVAFYADLDGFTRYVQEAETDEKVVSLIRQFHMIRSEFHSVVETDYDGLVLQHRGDCILGILHLPCGQSSNADRCQDAVDLAVGLQSSMEHVLNEHLTDRKEIHVAVGLDAGKVIVTRLGKKGERITICFGPEVTEAERLQYISSAKQIRISAEVYGKLDDEDVKEEFTKRGSAYVATGLTFPKLDEKKEEKAAETGTLGASVSQGQIRVTTAATVAAKPWHNSKPWMSE